MNNKRFAVIGGTIYDTDLGFSILKDLGINAIKKNIKNTPIQQEEFQLNHNIKHDINDHIIVQINNLKNKYFISHVLIYCVSMSGLIDHTKITNQTGVQLITPYTSIYDKLKNFNKLGVLSANNLSADNFEKHILKFNKNCNVSKMFNLNIVTDIEKKMHASTIVKNYKLDIFLENLKKNKINKLVLGCTHFSYLMNELSQLNEIEIFDVKSFIINELESKYLYHDKV